LKPRIDLSSLGGLVSAVSGEHAALELLSRMLDSLSVGLALYDASDDNFRILYANPAALELAGYAGENPLGRRLVDAFPTAGQNQTLDVFREVRDTGVAKHFRNVTLFSSGGRQRSWNWDVYPIMGVNGSVGQVMGVGHDVSDLVQPAQDVKRVIIQARERPGCEQQVDDDAIESPILAWHVADTSKGLLHRSAVSTAA